MKIDFTLTVEEMREAIADYLVGMGHNVSAKDVKIGVKVGVNRATFPNDEAANELFAVARSGED